MAAEAGRQARGVATIIAAAGRSERAGPGEPKQFRAIAGVPMLLRSLQPFAEHPGIREIVIAMPAAQVRVPPPWLDQALDGRVRLVEGGDSRALSVRAALRALSDESDVVLVHDAARPFVSRETIDAVIAVAQRGMGAVAAVAVRDTLKRAAGNSRDVAETVDRSGLWCAHTPQGFPRSMLEDAYRRGAPHGRDWSATDEAMLVEAAGYRVELVQDRQANIKVTTPDDFLLAQALARP